MNPAITLPRSRTAGIPELMHSSASGTLARIVPRSFTRAARRGPVSFESQASRGEGVRAMKGW